MHTPTLWTQLGDDALKARIFAALEKNVSYETQSVFGIPGSRLDDQVFYRDADFLKDAPYLSTLLENPNHIGCHTMGLSEPFFGGTQEIERELITICGCEIMQGQADALDGYVASGGTEANVQAIWIYRNQFQQDGATPEDIVILCSEDSHYSVDKAGNLLGIEVARVPVDRLSRAVTPESISNTVAALLERGKRRFIVFVNMMTTMFGSVDDIDTFLDSLDGADVDVRVHVDAAFGGFYYPFTGGAPALDFSDPRVSSITLDAHKMLQAPYGTGIFLARKGLMPYATTDEAKYVQGRDLTVIGSRSGANAIAVWMILMKNGPIGWQEKVDRLQARTGWLCGELDAAGARYFRHPHSNIVAIASDSIDARLAAANWLVPDDHEAPAWFKIVVMDHVTDDKLKTFLAALSADIS